MEIYKCPKCKVEAQIDREKKSKSITHKIDLNRPQMTFPIHADCELAKAVGKINFSLLEKRIIV